MNYIPPIVSPNSSGFSSYTQRCLEETENYDLYKKNFNNEDFTDEDTKRLADCVDKKKETNEKVGVVAIVIVIVAFVLSLLLWKDVG